MKLQDESMKLIHIVVICLQLLILKENENMPLRVTHGMK